MKPDKAPAYWPTRIMLAVAIIATAIVVAFALWLASWAPSPFTVGGPIVWELPTNGLLTTVAVIGLVWVILIFRGPREEPPPWRHRDR
jgi:hypothetical protein